MATKKYLSILLIFGAVFLAFYAGSVLLGYGSPISTFSVIGLISYLAVLTAVYGFSRGRP